jgi:hypothetical protein
MRVRNIEQENNSEINFNAVQSYLSTEKSGKGAKFNSSMERRIEALWSRSEELGWSYSDFVVHLLEVLVVLSHRHKVSPMIASQRRTNTEIAA